MLLVCTIIEAHGKEALVTTDLSLGGSSSWLELRLLYVQFLTSYLNRPFLSIQNLL